jgi:hypothetical protein
VSEQTPAPAQPPPGLYMVKVMWVVGLVIVIGVALYLLFLAADGLGLESQEATATVVGKGYREAGQTYYTQIINNRPQVMPQATPERYLLKLDLAGREVECAVEKGLYDAVQAGDQVRATYQRRRLTGATQVVDVRR